MPYLFQSPDEAFAEFRKNALSTIPEGTPQEESYTRSLFLSGALWAISQFVDTLEKGTPDDIVTFAEYTSAWFDDIQAATILALNIALNEEAKA